MTKPAIFIPGVVVALALAATGVYLAGGLAMRWAGIAPIPTHNLAQGWSAHATEPSYHAPALELRLLNDAHVSLAQAVATAEHDAGGKAMDAFLDDLNGKPAYRIRVLKGADQIVTDWVDAASGQATQVGAPVAESGWSAYDRLAAANLDQSTINLGDAIALAKQGPDGRVVDADVSNVRGVLGYDVVVVARSKVDQLSITPDKTLTATADATDKPKAS